MNVEEVRKRVQAIESIADDDENAHVGEDKLWADVLRAIVQGAPNPGELALAALETEKIDFSRWYA